ncbi:MAG: TRAP transporter large permease [Lachnospiraceae bacterium]|nr:TRAP transporter large permease [Lachnospiraceae bacterium]
MNILSLMLLFGLMIALMLLGLPLAFSLFFSSIVVVATCTSLPVLQIVQKMFAGVDSFVLTAIPFFLLAGNIMNSGKITDKLINLASTMVGHLRGGLAHINVLVSLLFGGVSGSAVADTSGVGSILIPAMQKRGYPQSFTVAVTSTSSVLGQIIPPSLIMIIYASTSGASVQALFIAGIVPGIILAITMMIVSYYYALKYDYPREEKKSFVDFLKALKASVLVLIMPIIIIGGVLSGICTATESAVIAVVYSLIITLFIDRTLKLSDLAPVFIQTAKGTATSLFCIAGASAFGYLMAYFKVSELVLELIKNMNMTQWQYILFCIALFFFLGCFMDATPAICIFVPIVVPAGLALGLNATHLGIVICLLLAIGMVTPPYGLCLLIGCQISGIAPQKTFKDVGVMLGAVMVTLVVILLLPDLVLWLPRLVCPKFV